jgi:predicted methyltransferase
MKTVTRTICALLGALAFCGNAVLAQAVSPATFEPLLAGTQRSPGNVARDPYRHPAQTLAFFGIRADSKVVEILPGSGGYYMELLAPWLKDKGLYIAANRDASQPQYLADHQKLLQRLKDDPALYGKVVVTEFRADRHAIAPPGSADVVISFRNLHNWMDQNELEPSLKAFYLALKPGGVLGIVDHRGRTDQTQAQQTASGYVRQDVAIALIERSGFKLDATSEVNANPKDTKDYPEGVWTLPPSYRMKDVDRDKYRAIGESDRFTLRFIKQ